MDAKARAKLEATLKQARLVVASLEALLASEEEHFVVPPEVAALVEQRIAARICLACLLPILPDEPDRRGDHLACYNTLLTRVRRQETTLKEIIESGKLLPEGRKPGRKAALDLATQTITQSIADKIDAKSARAAESKEKYNKKS
jgi:hypothetical protein